MRSVITVSAADLEAVASPDWTVLNRLFKSVRNVDWVLSVLDVDEVVDAVVVLLDCELVLSSALWSVVAALWASFMSQDSADCSKLASVFATEFDCPPWPGSGGGGPMSLCWL